jgi:S1-C subfamily serine protease
VEANLIGEDPNLDVAVLKLEKPGPYSAIPFGSSDDLMIGETVIVIGNPFGLQNTVTTGVLSALERELTINQITFPGLIQTDAAINPGNSSGSPWPYSRELKVSVLPSRLAGLGVSSKSTFMAVFPWRSFWVSRFRT